MTLMPGLDSIRRARAEARAEEAFWRERYSRFLKQYPDQFLAVLRESGEVVAADSDLLSLVATISDKGLDTRQVWVRFLAHTPIHLAL
jgi:hypothetical protein